MAVLWQAGKLRKPVILQKMLCRQICAGIGCADDTAQGRMAGKTPLKESCAGIKRQIRGHIFVA